MISNEKNEGAGALLCVRGGEPTRHPSIHLLLTAVLLTPDQGPSQQSLGPRLSCSTSSTTSSASVACPLDQTTWATLCSHLNQCDPVAGSPLSLPLTVADA